MSQDRHSVLASLIVVFTGALWGVYWLPVRHLAELGLPGGWGTLAIVSSAALLFMPIAWWRRKQLKSADPVALASIAVGGIAFVCYSVGFLYGRVAIIILLFYLTPIWSTLIGRYLLGWPTPRLRIVAMALGIVGLAVMLGAEGEVPLPRGVGEWLALLSGMLWSVSTTGIRTRSTVGAYEAAFVFAAGAFIGALVLAPLLGPLPDSIKPGHGFPIIGWAMVAGSLWWGLFMVCLIWATGRLEPARVGILLMAEVIVGTISGAWLAGEHLSSFELVGGALVLCAGVLEVWPTRRNRLASGH